MASRNEVLSCLAMLSLAYPKEAGQYKDPRTIELWVRMLADLPGALLIQATQACIATLTWFPKIAEVRQAAREICDRANPVPRPHEAWSEVLREMERVGHLVQYGEKVTFSHPIVQQVVDLFGWERLCKSENLVSDRAQFLLAYSTFRDAAAASACRFEGTQQFSNKQSPFLLEDING